MTRNNTSNTTSQLVEIGKIGRPHGVRGEMRLFLHNPSSGLIFELDEILVAPDEDTSPVVRKIFAVKEGAKFIILALRGIQHRESAQKLCGHLVFVPRDTWPELEDGEFYVNDLMGMVVLRDGEPLGRIIESREQGGIEVVTVSNGEQEIQIPVVDEYVIAMDVDAKTMDVHNVDELPIFDLTPKV